MYSSIKNTYIVARRTDNGNVRSRVFFPFSKVACRILVLRETRRRRRRRRATRRTYGDDIYDRVLSRPSENVSAYPRRMANLHILLR